MGYVRPAALGFFGIDDILVASTAIKGFSAIASNASNIFNPGKSRDEQRLARANYFRDSAIAGSVTAARYVLGGEQNTGGNEIPYYQQAWSMIAAQRPDVANEAESQGAKWAAGIPDPGGTQSMVNDVKADLAALGQAAPTNAPTAPTAPTTQRAALLPPMQSTAPYNWTPWFIAGGLGLAAVALLPRGGRR